MIGHPEILSSRQLRVLEQSGPFLNSRGFYLAGGTALALYLGHRRSGDLDWFRTQRLEDPLRLAHDLRDAGLPFHTGQVAPGTLHGRVSGVRMTLLEYRYALLKPLTKWQPAACRLASLDDLAAMKVAALAQRGSRKDFVDLFALGLEHCSLGRMLRLYQRKYRVTDIAHVLYSLAYFDDAKREPMPRLLWTVRWLEIERTLGAWLRHMAGP